MPTRIRLQSQVLAPALHVMPDRDGRRESPEPDDGTKCGDSKPLQYAWAALPLRHWQPSKRPLRIARRYQWRFAIPANWKQLRLRAHNNTTAWLRARQIPPPPIADVFPARRGRAEPPFRLRMPVPQGDTSCRFDVKYNLLHARRSLTAVKTSSMTSALGFAPCGPLPWMRTETLPASRSRPPITSMV